MHQQVMPTAGYHVGSRSRLDTIDLVRGVVMVLMVLDHVRDYFTDVRFDPLDLTRTNPPLYFTRWVTHFCAPTFVFLAGTGAFLAGTRGKTKPQLAWFLFTRGLWLVVLEFTLNNFSWSFDVHFAPLIGQVIWAIGGSMVLLAGLVFLPTGFVTLLGIALVAGHNYFDGVRPDSLGSLGWLWMVAKSGGILEPLKSTGIGEPWSGLKVIVAYPILPWLGVMAVGYGFGSLWLLDRGRRRPLLMGLGLTLILLFVGLRFGNGYGDPKPWKTQSSDLFTLFAFLDCQKYPPSLLYDLMTLGPAILALGLFDRPLGSWSRPLVTFGRVPLFYYLLHVPLIHLLAVAFALVRYGDAAFLFRNPLFMRFPEGYGYGLPVVYLLSVVVVGLLFPACWWFAGVKRRHPDGWLSYL
jgi:uncharacterized membrane protein